MQVKPVFEIWFGSSQDQVFTARESWERQLSTLVAGLNKKRLRMGQLAMPAESSVDLNADTRQRLAIGLRLDARVLARVDNVENRHIRKCRMFRQKKTTSCRKS